MRSTLHIAIVIAGLSGLAGCEGLPDLPKFSAETENSPARISDAEIPTKSDAGPPANTDEVLFLDRAGIRQLQDQLARRGFRPGPADGINGPNTIGAIKRYQSATGLPATGKITRALVDSLDLPRTAHAEPVTPGALDLPTYQIATTYIYSDGSAERVIGVDGSVVKWARNDGTTYATHRNFLMPWSYWTSSGEQGTARVPTAPEGLWPRSEGAEISFSATINLRHGTASGVIEKRVEQWRCRNAGDKKLVVPAGRFHTVVFVCRRTANGAVPSLVRIWYYAEKIRHYVRFVEKGPDGGVHRKFDLVAVRPGTSGWPPIVRAGLMRAIVRALEAPDDEVRIPWRSSGVDVDVIITAKAPFSNRNARTCRRFEEVWTQTGHQRHYPGVACKILPDRWKFPGLENSSDYALAISN